MATTGHVSTLSGEQTHDGVTTSVSRILLWRQTDATTNGIYVTGSGAWIRAADADVSGELVSNFSVYVQSGTLFARQVFRFTTTGPVTLGTTPLTFEPMPHATTVDLTNLPANPIIGWIYTVTSTDGSCEGSGLQTVQCWSADGLNYQMVAGNPSPPDTLESARSAGNVITGAVSETSALTFRSSGGATFKQWFAGEVFMQQCRDGDEVACDFSTQLAAGKVWELRDSALGTLLQVTEAGVIRGSAIPVTACTSFDQVTFSDDNKLFASFDFAVTITEIWCNYEGTAPTTVAQFTLGIGTHTVPVCAAPTAAGTKQAVTGGTLATRVPLRVSVSNTPNPATDSYLVCVKGTRN